MSRTLYRSPTSRMLGGVCGGLGEFLDVDPTIIRLVAVIALVASFGVVLLFYILAWILIPPREFGQEIPAGPRPRSKTWTVYAPGLLLIAIGAAILLAENAWWFSFEDLWPVIIIAIGVLMIVTGASRKVESSASGRSPQNASADSSNGTNGGTRS